MTEPLHPYQPLISTEKIIKNYQLLSSQDPQTRERANRFLMTLPDYEETWGCCQVFYFIRKDMIQSGNDTNFVLLGAQLLYQKVEKDLHQFDTSFKIQLKNFLFGELDSGKHTKTFVIDKLASSAALIVASLYLNQWPNFVEDLTEFMKKSANHLLCGLIVLERIPEELRMTNRIPQGVKSKIQGKFLQNEALFSLVFDSVFELKDESCIRAVLKTIQSWIRICYHLIKYPNLVTKVLQNSLQNIQKLQIGIKVICQAVKLVSEQKSPGLSLADPAKEQESYTATQIQSLQTIITYVLENKKNFLSFATTEPEYTEMYLQLIKQLLMSFGFLILENLGFELLSTIKEMTQSRDLKLSFSTFEFWTDYIEKMSRIKLSPEVKEKIWNEFVNLLEMFSQKLVIANESLMVEADLKDDETGDDADGMSFTEYRKEAGSLLRAIYDYLVKMNKQQGAEIYFKKVVYLLENDNPPLNRYTQLALFLLKSPLESMINPYQTGHIIQILQYLISKINSHNTLLHPIPPIVLGETMNFIRDCTREIKEKDQLFLEALKFVLNYINDEKLCHHAAYCFQILMETINTLNEPIIAESLIQFYSQKKFSKQVVLQKMLEGIFNAIIKVPDQQKVESYLDSILNTLLKKYHQCSKIISSDQENRSDLYLSLVQIKTVLDSYDSSSASFKQLHRSKFVLLANKSVDIVNEILPLGIKNSLKFSVINEVGLAISIYRVGLKILQTPQSFVFVDQSTPSFILSLNIPLMILTEQNITEYYYTITIFSQTLIQFINHPSPYLDTWLQTHLSFFNQFFLHYYQSAQKIDPDVVKMFITVEESLVLYNREIFFVDEQKNDLLKVALHALRHLNERNMQRKIVGFINLGLENEVWPSGMFQTIVENVFASIPIIHSMCYNNLAKIFKYLFKKTTMESKQSIFTGLLALNPYQELDQTLRSLLAKAMTWALLTEEERNIKTFFVQLNEIVWKKVSSDVLMQLELKIATWKREYKKVLAQQQQQQQQHGNTIVQ